MLKSLSLAILSLSTLSASASLLDHVAYTSDGISAECSDYLGKVSSAGPIALRDFLIHDGSGAAGCALNSAVSVAFLRGKVLANEKDAGCIGTPRLSQHEVYFGRQRSLTVDTNALTAEMHGLSHQIENGSFPARVVSVDPSAGDIVLDGSSNEILVVRIAGKNVVIADVGVTMSPALSPDRIIWHFPEAETLTITRSGMNPADFGFNIGLPGTFLAPNAIVSFHNALITGALYAKRITAPAWGLSCTGVVAGQINPGNLTVRPQKPSGGKGK